MFHYPLVMGTYRHCHNPFQKITSTTRVIWSCQPIVQLLLAFPRK
jgi:hypothetical protein